MPSTYHNAGIVEPYVRMRSLLHMVRPDSFKVPETTLSPIFSDKEMISGIPFKKS